MLVGLALGAPLIPPNMDTKAKNHQMHTLLQDPPLSQAGKEARAHKRGERVEERAKVKGMVHEDTVLDGAMDHYLLAHNEYRG